jgi:hypothetical protein
MDRCFSIPFFSPSEEQTNLGSMVCVCVCVVSHSTFYSFCSEAYNGSLIIYFHLLCRNEISVFMQKPTPPTYHPTHSRTLPPPDQGSDKNFFYFCCNVPLYLFDNLFDKLYLSFGLFIFPY